MKKLLWVGDAVAASGFARATHGILETVRHHFEVVVLGVNHQGDPHDYPYPIYAAPAGGDGYGVGRIVQMCTMLKPDLIVIQTDGWIVPSYMAQIKRLHELEGFVVPPVVAIVAVDGKNFQGKWLKGVELAIFWTEFAIREAEDGGYRGKAAVAPLGVDLNTYQPRNKFKARHRRGLPAHLDDLFIVGNVNRNQPRKRWDLTVRYFAEWIKRGRIDDAFLLFHTAPTGDQGTNIKELVQYYGITKHFGVVEPPMYYGVSEDALCDTYNCFDVQITTTQGEGMGLTTLEGMACKIPQIVPGWSALQELCEGAAIIVPCTSTATTPGLSVIGGVPDEEKFIAALDALYREKDMRESIAWDGLKRVSEPRFRWENVGQHYAKLLQTVKLREEVPA